MGIIGKLLKASSKYGKSGTNAYVKAQGKIRKAGAKMKQKLSQSDRKVFRNADDQGEFYEAKALKEKKHIADRSKQTTRISDSKKRKARISDSEKKIEKTNKPKKAGKVAKTALLAGTGAAAYYEGKTGNISKAVKTGTKKAMGTVEKVIKRAETALKKNPDKYLKRRPPLSGAAKKNKK